MQTIDKQRDQRICKMARIPGMTLQKIADEFGGISRERIRQILVRNGVSIFESRKGLVAAKVLESATTQCFVRNRFSLAPIAYNGASVFFPASYIEDAERQYQEQWPKCAICGAKCSGYGRLNCSKCSGSPEAQHIRYENRATIKRFVNPLYKKISEQLARGRCNVNMREFIEISGLSRIQCYYLQQRGLVSYSGTLVNVNRLGLWSRYEAEQIAEFRKGSTNGKRSQ